MLSGKRLLVAAFAALLVLGVSGAAGADSFTLTVVSQNSTTITFSYPQQTGFGYLYSANGTVVSRTNDPAKTQVKFAKANSYEVAAIVKGATGSYPVTPPPPKPVCSNGVDDDGDGKVDYPNDPGCTSVTDSDETDPAPPKAACSDSVDNDGDGKVDYPADPGCSSLTDTDETDTVQPPPTTITSSQCGSRASVVGAVIENVTVTGGCTIGAANVTLRNATLSGSVSIGPSAVGARLLDSRALGFDLKGADNVLIQGNVFDGQGRRDNNEIWDSPSGNVPDNWVVRGNTFKNFYIDDGSTHSEAMFVGYSQGGLIENNTFTNNGNTGHLFFTWWGGVANPATSYPRNICIRGNTFNATHDAFYDANFRDEIPTSAGIKLQRNASTGWPQFYADC